jgi:hypothetical protein
LFPATTFVGRLTTSTTTTGKLVMILLHVAAGLVAPTASSIYMTCQLVFHRVDATFCSFTDTRVYSFPPSFATSSNLSLYNSI